MTKEFIEVHVCGEPFLLNVAWIEMVYKKTTGGSEIYMAFCPAEGVAQDYLTTDESYETVVGMIRGGGGYRGRA